MKKIDSLFKYVDQHVEKKVMPLWVFIQRHFSLFSGTLLLVLLGVFVVRMWSDRSQVLAVSVSEDLAAIQLIFNRIDKECNILNIRSSNAYIDFLTVEKFTGSTIGPLNLAYPQNWQGPYVKQNPVIGQIPYQIIQAKDGYFLLPGHGVLLPNKLVLGKDLIIDHRSNVVPMLKPGGQLNYNGNALGIKLSFLIGDWDTPRPSKETVQEINNIMTEFNEALPYVQSAQSGDKSIQC